jgi:hypothetical protein
MATRNHNADSRLHRICCRCKIRLPKTEFYKNRLCRGGLDVRCIACDKDYRLHIRSGITRIVYEEILASQGGRCAICRTDTPNMRSPKSLFCVDHDHKTRLIRGLVCNRCNLVIGIIGEDAEALSRASDYLRRGQTEPARMVPESHNNLPNGVYRKRKRIRIVS